MEFKLFYKVYNYKSNLRAIKQFKESTGLDLWATLTDFMGTYIKCRNDGVSVSDMLKQLSGIIGFVDAAQLFYCLAKQDSSLTIDEIEDAMFHAGIFPNDNDNDMSQPYTMVLYQICLDVHNYHSELAKEEKKH